MYRLTEPLFRPEKYRHNNITAKRKVTQVAFLFAVVIYVYIFVLDKTPGFGCRHLT